MEEYTVDFYVASKYSVTFTRDELVEMGVEDISQNGVWDFFESVNGRDRLMDYTGDRYWRDTDMGSVDITNVEVSD